MIVLQMDRLSKDLRFLELMAPKFCGFAIVQRALD